MIFNVTKRRENKHTDKPHDWKRGKRGEARKESASYVSRLFLILKVFAVLIITTFGQPGLDIQWWCKCVSPISYQRCICHDHSNSDFDHHHLHICTLMFEREGRRGDVMGQGIHKIEICLRCDSEAQQHYRSLPNMCKIKQVSPPDSARPFCILVQELI